MTIRLLGSVQLEAGVPRESPKVGQETYSHARIKYEQNWNIKMPPSLIQAALTSLHTDSLLIDTHLI